MGACLVFLHPLAHAEKWAAIGGDSGLLLEVDLNNIRRDVEGLTFFNLRTNMGIQKKALDCRNRFDYVLAVGARTFPEWRSQGTRILPKTTGSDTADFVCARLP